MQFLAEPNVLWVCKELNLIYNRWLIHWFINYHKHCVLQEKEAYILKRSLLLHVTCLRRPEGHRCRKLSVKWFSSAKQHILIDLVLCRTIASRSPTSRPRFLASWKSFLSDFLSLAYTLVNKTGRKYVNRHTSSSNLSLWSISTPRYFNFSQNYNSVPY